MCAQKPRSGLKTSLSGRAVHPRQSRFAACGYFGHARCPTSGARNSFNPHTPVPAHFNPILSAMVPAAPFLPIPGLYPPEPLQIESLGLN